MDLGIKEKLFIVTGATSGLGNGCACALLNEGAKVIAVARDRQKLDKFYQEYPEQLTILSGDITTPGTISQIIETVGDQYMNGIVINSGGPPAKSFQETEMTDWDQAYNNILRWKVGKTGSQPGQTAHSPQSPGDLLSSAELMPRGNALPSQCGRDMMPTLPTSPPVPSASAAS